MVVFGLSRYRLSADLTIAVLAAIGLIAATHRFGPNRETSSPPDN